LIRRIRMARIGKIIAILCTLVFLAVSVSFAAAEPPIKIGSVLRLSIGAEHGIPSKRGVLMAVKTKKTLPPQR
jgi:hypothetical protein